VIIQSQIYIKQIGQGKLYMLSINLRCKVSVWGIYGGRRGVH